jgi:hypothetical protein
VTKKQKEQSKMLRDSVDEQDLLDDVDEEYDDND